MVIIVAGKQNKKGTSKAGRPYDFNVIHFCAPKKGVEGNAAQEKIVDQSVISYTDILVNQAYEVETDLDGNIIAMIPARA